MGALVLVRDHPETTFPNFGIIAGWAVVANISKPSASASGFADVSMRDLQFTTLQPDERAPIASFEESCTTEPTLFRRIVGLWLATDFVFAGNSERFSSFANLLPRSSNSHAHGLGCCNRVPAHNVVSGRFTAAT